MKQSWNQLNPSNIAILLMGKVVGEEMQEQILRASEMGAKVNSSQDIAEKIGAPVISILGMEAGTSVLTYPKSGLPQVVVDRIGASTEAEVEALIKKTGKMPFSIVVADLSCVDIVEAETIEHLRDQIHYNTEDALRRGIAAGKITCTSAKQLKRVLNLIESDTEISEEIYGNIATWSAKTTLRALREWSRELTDSADVVFDRAKAELTEIDYFTSVKEEEVRA
jgi:hypothetical protein